jgi:hypothetical protein
MPCNPYSIDFESHAPRQTSQLEIIASSVTYQVILILRSHPWTSPSTNASNKNSPASFPTQDPTLALQEPSTTSPTRCSALIAMASSETNKPLPKTPVATTAKGLSFCCGYLRTLHRPAPRSIPRRRQVP